MIPKKIHYCWFGKGPKNKLFEKCLKSWKKYMPDYEIIEWNESNFDIDCNAYVKEAYDAKKYAFVSDYARLKIVYENGGIYLDTDVELLKTIPDEALKNGYFAKEKENTIATGLGFAAKKGEKIILELMESYNDEHFLMDDGNFNLITCVQRVSDDLNKLGYSINSELTKVGELRVYSPEYFCGYDLDSNHYVITDNTISVHHYNATWLPIKKRFKKKLKRIISRIIGRKNYLKLRKLKRGKTDENN